LIFTEVSRAARGQGISLRNWNDDETDGQDPNFGPNPIFLHITLYTR